MSRTYQFNWKNAAFDYEPYPICYVPNVLNEADYKILSESYPDIASFKFKEHLGDKYSLAEKNNKDFYYQFLKQSQPWSDFYRAIKSKKFIEEILALLKQHNIDLGIKDFAFKAGEIKRRRSISRTIDRIIDRAALGSRFEFSIMRANGGHILPHTDHASKLVTVVFSFIKPNEWDPAWGGGTNVELPKDRTLSYNFVNKQMQFAEMDILKTFPFRPNQALLFVKTFNSFHSVLPMTGPESGLRKTVTINIENLR